MYEISTIGDLTPPPAAPAPAPADASVSAPLVAAVALAGVLVGALGLWALRKYT